MALYLVFLYLNLGSRICGPVNGSMGKVSWVKESGMFHMQMIGALMLKNKAPRWHEQLQCGV